MDARNSYCFLFCNGKLLVKESNGYASIPLVYEMEASLFKRADAQYIGLLHEAECFAANLDNKFLPDDYSVRNLRDLYGLLDHDCLWTAYRASHILNWMKSNRFCGCCGSEMTMLTQELALKCVSCGHIVYPRISPAIIVAVTNNDQILLARSYRFPPGRYSVIAGFVEPGETLEDCVKRELHEEVGIEVRNIRYFGSQPWPFPDSLMVGFTAEYVGGKIAVDNKEIAAADWFPAHNLPDLPPEDSIARQLINHFVQKSTV